MRKLCENFHIFHFQKSIVSAETIRGNKVIFFFLKFYESQQKQYAALYLNWSTFEIKMAKTNPP